MDLLTEKSSTRGKVAGGENRNTEGPVAKAIEKRTTNIPLDWFLWAGLGSIALSATLQSLGKKQESNFVGHWAPTLLILGLYNKLVKLEGSDRTNKPVPQDVDPQYWGGR